MLRKEFANFTDFRPRKLHVAQVHGLVDELLVWARAFGALRVASPAVSQQTS
ncbi:hypothetical protein [Nocardia sp. NPDC005998]|uniref:hypothetical protein n=1 Tax=Nocardia sp. NPDC005998 TaxID=3156894 RepID=UPI0033B5288F